MSNFPQKFVERIKHLFPNDRKLHAALDAGNEFYVVQALNDFILAEYKTFIPALKLLNQLRTDRDALEDRLGKLSYVEFLLKQLENKDIINFDDILESVSR